MDAAATVTEAAPAGLEVVADFIDLLELARGAAGLGLSARFDHVGETAIVPAVAVAIHEVVALALRTGLASARGAVAVTVSEAALVPTVAGAIAEIEALAPAAATAARSFLLLIAV